MNILILTFQGDMAGSTNSISYLARGLASQGHRVWIGCPAYRLLVQLIKDTPVGHIPMDFNGRLDWHNMKQIKRTVQTHQIQLINAQSSYDRYTSVLAKWFFKLSVKIVHTRRQVSLSVGGFFQNLIYVKGTNKVVAVSEGVKVSLVRGGIPAQHIEVIHNGTPSSKYENIDHSLTEKFRELYKLRDDEVVIGCVSRRKSQDQILKALKTIDFPATVIFVGIDRQQDWQVFVDEVSQKHRIIFAGALEQAEVLAHFGLFTINILASTIEGMSQSLLESMALGVPVIATNAAGNPELIQDEINGLLFDDGDIRALSRCIDILVHDMELRKKIIKNAKSTALVDFNIENTVNKYVQLFKRLIHEDLRGSHNI